MKNSKSIIIGTVSALILASFIIIDIAVAQQQQSGVKRTELQRYDLSVPGREVRQVHVELAPGVSFPKHTHPGEEIIYVTEGLLEYQVGDNPPKTYKAGDVLFIPAGMPHSAKNPGKSNGAELATYIVEKGKPLLDIVKPKSAVGSHDR